MIETNNNPPKQNIVKNTKKKNWAILAIIAAFVVIIWAVTMIKIGNMS